MVECGGLLGSVCSSCIDKADLVPRSALFHSLWICSTRHKRTGTSTTMTTATAGRFSLLVWLISIIVCLVAFLWTILPRSSWPPLPIPSQHEQQPLTIVITGATNGIGLSLTRYLYSYNYTLVALGRSSEKLKALQKELPNIQTFLVDLSNLSAVSKVADQMVDRLDKIDILVNNAGMHGGLDLFGSNNDGGPHDKVFTVNYLSHFLLTEKLLPTLQKAPSPRIVQTTSAYHWSVDGSDLSTSSSFPTPIAARPGGSHGWYLFRTSRSYSNSKLAQLLHLRALPHFNGTKKCFCPGWVGTRIGGQNDVFFYMLQAAGFDVNRWGIASALLALFDDAHKDTDYYINGWWFRLPELIFQRPTPQWLYRYGLRDAIGNAFAWTVLVTQKLAPSYAGPAVSSPESYNETLQKELYEWSVQAVAPYL